MGTRQLFKVMNRTARRGGNRAVLSTASCLTVFGLSILAAAQTRENGVTVIFPDAALETAVRAAILRPSGPILDTDLVGVGFVSLTADGGDIANLSGLEHCADLQELSLRNNVIEDLSPLSALTNLTLLDLNNNLASDITPIASLPNLVTLRVKQNGISVLPALVGLTRLETITAGQNMIVDLAPLGDLSSLTTVGLANNSIVSIVPLRENFALGEGGILELSGNPLGEDAICRDIATLQERGVDVVFDGACTGVGGQLLHSADLDGDTVVGFDELLRVVQLYNSGQYSCDSLGEDGFAPGAGDQTCPPHRSDYAPQDWAISLSEVLRLIQMFNAGGYHDCPAGEDHFCAGQKVLPPNVVYIVVDTMRAGRIQAVRNGLPVAPFLKSFAAQGAHFTDAHAPSSWTRPSMFGFFTGMYPNPELTDGGQSIELFSIPFRLTGIGEWFAGHGYDCWGVQTNGNASEGLGFAQGFKAGRYELLSEYPAALVTDTLLHHLPEWKEPFFSFVQYIDPHGPYAPPVEYQEVFGPQPVLDIADEMNLGVVGFRPYVQKLFGAWVNGTEPESPVLSEDGKAAMHYRYDAEIRYFDDELERFITNVQATHPNTIFVVVSDHGEALQDREELIGHGHTLYDEQTNVPLIFHGPGVESQVIDTRVEALGILPTLASLLGFTPLSQWQGADCFAQAANHGMVYGTSLTFFEETPVFGDCVTVNGMKFVEHNMLDVPHLFDLAADPGETANIAVDNPGSVTLLRGLLDLHRDEVAQSGGSGNVR